MALPAGWTLVPLEGTYVRQDGQPSKGRVLFQLSTVVVVDDVIVVPRQLVAPLDDNGSISIALPATDDPDIMPGGWTWTVVEQLDTIRREYAIEVPHDSPGIDLATVSPVAPVTDVTGLLTDQDLGSRVFGWDAHNDVTLPPGLQLATIRLSDEDQNPDTLPHRFRFVWDGLQTGGFNQFGELRSFASSDSRVAFRATGRSASHTEAILQALLHRNGPLRFEVTPDVTRSVMPIEAPNVKGAVVAIEDGAELPAGLSTGTVVVRYDPVGEPATITYVGGSADGSQGSASITLTWPTGLQADDYALIWWSTSTGSGQPDPPPGFELVEQFAADTGSQLSGLYARRLNGTESGDLVLTSGGGNRHSAVLSIYRGIALADAISDYAVMNTPASGTSHPSPSVDVTHEGSVVVVAYGERLSSGTTDITAPPGYPRRQHSGALASGGGGTYVATADDGLAGQEPGTVQPGDWSDGVSTNNVVTWTVALRPRIDASEFTSTSVTVLGAPT